MLHVPQAAVAAHWASAGLLSGSQLMSAPFEQLDTPAVPDPPSANPQTVRHPLAAGELHTPQEAVALHLCPAGFCPMSHPAPLPLAQVTAPSVPVCPRVRPHFTPQSVAAACSHSPQADVAAHSASAGLVAGSQPLSAPVEQLDTPLVPDSPSSNPQEVWHPLAAGVLHVPQAAVAAHATSAGLLTGSQP